jgi:tetratricopeptide (TPR) repeat protein
MLTSSSLVLGLALGVAGQQAAPAPSSSSAAAAPAAAPAPAALLPYLAVVPLAPAGAIKPKDAHLGSLLAVMLENAALQNPGLNVVTQGAQAELLDDMGLKPGTPITEETAKKLAMLTGATHVVFGTFEPATGAAFTAKVRTFGVLAGTAKDLVVVTAPAADLVARLAEALGRELGLSALPAPTLPATEKAQKGYAACATFTAVALERAAVKGRKVTPPRNALAACKDAAADKSNAAGHGALLAARLLTGDAKALGDMQKHVAANPSDRLAALVLLRRLFEDGKFEDAATLLKAVAVVRPRDPDVFRMAGELEIQKDAWDSARRNFQNAVNEAPNSPYLRYRLSYASYRTDQPKDALEHARQALKLSGGDAPFYQLNLAERLLDSGQASEAALQLERSVKATPNRLTPRVRLGYAYLLQGDADNALQTLQDAEKIPASDREKDRGMDLLLKIDLARAHALKGNTKDALKYLKALEKAGALETADLNAPEFQKLRDTPEFKKLKAR